MQTKDAIPTTETDLNNFFETLTLATSVGIPRFDRANGLYTCQPEINVSSSFSCGLRGLCGGNMRNVHIFFACVYASVRGQMLFTYKQSLHEMCVYTDQAGILPLLYSCDIVVFS
jgi:hypothetical protein